MPWKKQRVGTTRSRVGCLTCRQRHVKCDEARPACLRCRKANFICHFGPKEPLSLSTAHNVSNAVSQNRAERRCFEFFCRRTSPAIQGYFDSGFWNSLVLQVSHSEPSVRHAIIALGSLHEQFGSRDAFLPSDAQSLIEGDFAMEQYSKAVRHLRSNIASGTKNAVHISLICAVLFICFDNLNGDTEKATTHLRSALSILCESDSGQDQKCDVTREQLGNLADMLARFDIQSSSYIDVRDFRTQVKPLKPVPATFSDLHEAEKFLISDLNWVLHLDRSNDYYLAFRSSDPVEMEAKAYTFPYASLLATRLREWSTKFDLLLASSIATMKSRDLRASTLLKIYHAIGTILITVCQNSNETTYDSCLGEFEKILKLCSSLLAAQRQDSTVGISPFSCEMGLICALGFTAKKCRHPAIRRKALELLAQAPRREGPWDLDVALRVAERIILIEEDGLGEIKTADEIPSAQRVHGVLHTVERGERAIRLNCILRPWGEDDNEGYYIRKELIE